MSDDLPTFRRRAVRPIECLRAGWQLIRDDYWLFLGISIVGILIAGAIPLGIAVGPVMCGIHVCLFRLGRGERIKFEHLAEGIHHFVPSLVAHLVIIVPTLILTFLAMGLTVGGLALWGPKLPANGPPPPEFWTTILVTFTAIGVVMSVLSVLLSAFSVFAFPLIVDRGLSGLDAVRVSARAVLANFWGVVGLVILNALIGLAGMLVCCVGSYFVMPLTYAAVSVAYRRVFDPEPEPIAEPPPELSAGA